MSSTRQDSQQDSEQPLVDEQLDERLRQAGRATTPMPAPYAPSQAVDEAWRRAWDQVQADLKRRARLGQQVQPFAMLELMEEVYVQLRDDLHQGQQHQDRQTPRRSRPTRDDDYGAAAGQ